MAEDSSWYLPLSFSLPAVVDHLSCPICMCVIKQCATTQCGHSFCAICIRQCLNLKHQCPVCKADATAESLVATHAWDALIERLSREKAAAAKEYFRRLSSDAMTPQQPPPMIPGPVPPQLSVVEEAFRSHHQAALLAYQGVCADVAREFKARRAAVQEAEEGLGAAERTRRLELERAAEAESLALLAEDYCAQLRTHAAPLPGLGSMAVTLLCDVHTVEGAPALQGVRVRLPPSAFLGQLRAALTDEVATLGDPFLVGPLDTASTTTFGVVDGAMTARCLTRPRPLH